MYRFSQICLYWRVWFYIQTELKYQTRGGISRRYRNMVSNSPRLFLVISFGFSFKRSFKFKISHSLLCCICFISRISLGRFCSNSQFQQRYRGVVLVFNYRNAAEDKLKEALNASGHKWELNPGDGAFYGPKVG